MNFNISKKPEYNLFRKNTKELINLYGIEVTYFVTEKIHQNHILGENHRISLDPEKSFKIFLAPDATENWGGMNAFSSFGFQNLESLVTIISADDMERIHPNIVNLEGSNFDFIIGDIVIFDSGKIMEVSMISPLVEGNNNLFGYSDRKNAYKLTLKTHIDNNDDVSSLKAEQSEEYEKIENLEEIFELDIQQTKTQKENKKDKNSKKEIIPENSNYNSLFGRLGWPSGCPG